MVPPADSPAYPALRAKPKAPVTPAHPTETLQTEATGIPTRILSCRDTGARGGQAAAVVTRLG